MNNYLKVALFSDGAWLHWMQSIRPSEKENLPAITLFLQPVCFKFIVQSDSTPPLP